MYLTLDSYFQESAVIDFLAMEAIRALSPASLKPVAGPGTISAPASHSTLVSEDRYDSPTATVSCTSSLSEDDTTQDRITASKETLGSMRGESVGTPTLGGLAHLLFAAKNDAIDTPAQLHLAEVLPTDLHTSHLSHQFRRR